MIINKKDFLVNGLQYTIRSAIITDASDLSKLRLQIDGETENLDREKGESFIDEIGFKNMIKTDTEHSKNLFLVAIAHNRIIGFSRCEGSHLNRISHRVEFGVCVLRDFWGNSIGKNLLKESIVWADSNGIKKMTLKVLETNNKAINLYKSHGFEIEGILKKDKFLSDGKFYNTIVMGRFNET